MNLVRGEAYKYSTLTLVTVHFLDLAKPKLLIVHAKNFGVALEAASGAGLEESRIVVIASTVPAATSFDSLITDGEKLPAYVEPRLSAGENKSRIAFLVFSSGTSGLPKVVLIRPT